MKERSSSPSRREPAQGLGPEEALARLIRGNRRFSRGRCLNPDRSPLRRARFLDAQYPYAMILGCADSRVPPEVLFDVGIGDLFVVRHVGNIADVAAVAGAEYAILHLDVPLVMVLGHENCGALRSAARLEETPEAGRGELDGVLRTLRPALRRARGRPGDPIENAVLANVEMQVSALRRHPGPAGEAIRAGKAKLVGAYYRLSDGSVRLIASENIPRPGGAIENSQGLQRLSDNP